MYPARTSNLMEDEAACLDEELEAVTNDIDVAPSAAPPAIQSADAYGATLTPSSAPSITQLHATKTA